MQHRLLSLNSYHYRRGGSDVVFRGASDLDLWSDQLEQLLHLLDAWPAYLAGASSGARVSIRTALRYPDAVRGLFLWLLSGGPVTVPLAQTYYGEAAVIAPQNSASAARTMGRLMLIQGVRLRERDQ